MRSARQFIASLALLLAAGSAGAQAHAEDAVSYRDAYRAMVQFEKYGGPKNLLVSQLQVLPKERGALAEGLQLLLSGRSTQLSLPLDLLGRTVFPLQKAAYDDNAALSLSRKGLGFVLRPQVSIAVRPDGVYDVLELRAGCAQALGFARYVDASQRARQCAGVRFVFPRKTEGGARLRRPDSGEQVLAPVIGEPDDFPAVIYRFQAGAERGQVATFNAPLAILPLFE
ncbi:hypothetical protein ACFQ09_22340 [Massilia norwichensis]|jgi:hypothetical protein|uniref:Uncharacterized protein n=1 Tax=Massilia norwichensis TaxID=1442366 RepID=A0ABT2A519_9BURK|nr:hypothetical protein [Massilia norwichensis]MCS0589292.1 hypothetical protein [Massilia norwichensis]